MKKGQALLLIFFIFIIISILTGALAAMWTAEVKARSLERNGLAAFYIAQAGLELAKNLLRYYSWGWAGETATFGGGSYTVSVVSVSANEKRITSTGSYGNATRKITVVILDTFTPKDWSWQEQ